LSIQESQYIPIPKDGVPPEELRTQIESLLPPPRIIPGWKFVGYRWPRVSQIQTRDKDGNVDNTVRLGGTGDRETLETTLPKGVDITKHPPSFFGALRLLNGFNRTKKIPQAGYEYWIYSEYEEDLLTRTEFQATTDEAVDDLRATFNRDEGAVVITTDEIQELVRNRFDTRIDFESEVTDEDKAAMVRYVESLNLNLSGNQEKGIVNSVLRDFKRRGRIESVTRKEAETFVNEGGFGADVINTKDITRLLRLWPKIMENYIQYPHKGLNLIDFNSGATSHDQVDDSFAETQRFLENLDELSTQYGTLRSFYKIKDPTRKPWHWLGSIFQKIGTPRPTDGLVRH
tara:strand:- start:445 stop:1476 length:1032 start_codon:yes stop_codon:yes gene_type:complete